MTRHLVITSINAPTAAVIAYSRIPDLRVTVVGDLPSPQVYDAPGVTFLSVTAQKRMPYRLASCLPFRHYCRKMLGYLHAIAEGAHLLIDTDDDNIPEDSYGFPAVDGSFRTIPPDRGFVNIYELAAPSSRRIWPRGLPLRLIREPTLSQCEFSETDCKVGIWQGLANVDPDVDAIYRLTDGAECRFEYLPPTVLGAGTISPFNSQNTLFSRELFAALYLPCTVTFRFTDILRSYVAQPLLWAAGYRLGFIGATVRQERNPHDFFKDFLDEVPMYRHCETAVEVCSRSAKPGLPLAMNLRQCYEGLAEAGIVQPSELTTLDAWLNDLSLLGVA